MTPDHRLEPAAAFSMELYEQPGHLMNDVKILEHITALVAEEHQLREGAESPGENAERLRHVAEQLDQCWDLLR